MDERQLGRCTANDFVRVCERDEVIGSIVRLTLKTPARCVAHAWHERKMFWKAVVLLPPFCVCFLFRSLSHAFSGPFSAYEASAVMVPKSPARAPVTKRAKPPVDPNETRNSLEIYQDQKKVKMFMQEYVKE